MQLHPFMQPLVPFTRAACLGLALGALGCSHAPRPVAAVVPEKGALCEMPVPMRGGAPRPMRPNDWMQLMLTVENRGDAKYAETACTHERIEHLPLPSGCEVQTADPGVPTPIPLTDASVVEHLLPEGKRLVWIMTHRYPNGDGYGPVAAVTMTDKQVYVGSLGFLQLRPLRVDLGLWRIGDKAVLIGEGESCKRPEQASSCRRASHLLVYNKHRFHAVPIRRSDTNECIDAPWVEQKREADITLDNGWNRRIRINATVSHDERYVVITEHVEIADTDPNRPDVPPRDVRNIDTERFVHVDGDEFFTRQSPLWPRVIPTEGQTRVRHEYGTPQD